ncbi:MAG: hypothetical protein IT364_21290, partial [Candidatus Hydrogenedentes bacterium]|nr:hypothetical protein [Candidatus Hydrogenedentota bacterium]
PRFGIIGAAWSFVAAVAISALFQGASLNRCGLRLSARSAVAPQVSAGICLALAYYGQTPWARVIAFGLFVVLCLAASVVTPRQLVQWVRHIFPGHDAAPV